MPTANGRKGAETERMVAKYLRDQGFWMADRLLREGRQDDKGDIAGVPFTTVQVKYVESNRYQKWVEDTLRQRDTAGTPLCLLVRRVPRKPIEQWEASVPSTFFLASYEDLDGTPRGNFLPEGEAWTWLRMDLRLAVQVVKRLTDVMAGTRIVDRELRSDRCSPTTLTDSTQTAPATGT